MSITRKVKVKTDNLPWEKLLSSFPSTDARYENAANLLYALVNEREVLDGTQPPSIEPEQAKLLAEHFKTLKTETEILRYEGKLLEAFDIPATYYQQCAYIVKNHTKQAHLSDLLEEVTLKNKETLTKTIPKEQFLAALNSKKELTSVAVLSQIRAMIASEVKKVVNQEKEKAFGVSFWSRFSIPIFENGAVWHIAVPEGIYQLYALTDPSFSNNSGEGLASILKQISDICEKRKEISFFDRVLQCLGLGGRSDEAADTYNGILKSLPHSINSYK